MVPSTSSPSDVERALSAKRDLLQGLEATWRELRISLELKEAAHVLEATMRRADDTVEELRSLDETLERLDAHGTHASRFGSLRRQIESALESSKETHRKLTQKMRDVMDDVGRELASVRDNKTHLDRYRLATPRSGSRQYLA